MYTNSISMKYPSRLMRIKNAMTKLLISNGSSYEIHKTNMLSAVFNLNAMQLINRQHFPEGFRTGSNIFKRLQNVLRNTKLHD